jgi:hypothetical protein
MKYQTLKNRIRKIAQQPESHEAMIKRVMELNIYGGLSFSDLCSLESMEEIWGDDPD